MQLIHRSFARWMDFWFAPQAPTNLAACRVLVYGALFLLYLPEDFALWGTVSNVFWMPIFLFDILPVPVFSVPILQVLQVTWKVALLFSCLGFLTRLSTATSFIIGLYLLGLPHNLGKTHHFDAILVFVFAIMMASRCGDKWSIDRWLRRRRQPHLSCPGPSSEYRWPIRAVWLIFALIFFAAGFAKLRNSGVDWVLSDNLSVLLIKQHYFASEPDPLVDWGLIFAQSPLFYQPLAAITILLQICYPLALFSRRARWIIVPGMLMTQIGIRVILGPSFIQFIICHAFWLPWDRLSLPRVLYSRFSPKHDQHEELKKVVPVTLGQDPPS